MNDIDKTLIKYGFTKTPIQDEKLDKLAETTNKKIDKYIGKAKKQREHIVNKELKTINEIMNLNDDFIVTRSNFTIERHLNKDYVVGECFVDMNIIKKDLNKNIKKQESIEKKMMDEIKENIGDDEFLNLEHNIKSDDFLQYIIDNLK